MPLTPLLSLIATVDCRRQWRRLDPEQCLRMPGLWGGLLLSLAVLLLIELPNALTRIGLNRANSDRAETREQGIRWLRAIGNEHILLRACDSRTPDLAGAGPGIGAAGGACQTRATTIAPLGSAKSCPRSYPGQTDVHFFDPIGSKK